MNTSLPASAESTRAVLDRYLAALSAGDLDAIAASFDVDATWSLHGTLPLAGTRRVRDSIMEFLLSAGSLSSSGE